MEINSSHLHCHPISYPCRHLLWQFLTKIETFHLPFIKIDMSYLPVIKSSHCSLPKFSLNKRDNSHLLLLSFVGVKMDISLHFSHLICYWINISHLFYDPIFHKSRNFSSLWLSNQTKKQRKPPHITLLVPPSRLGLHTTFYMCCTIYGEASFAMHVSSDKRPWDNATLCALM